MGNISKGFSLLFIVILAVSSLITVEPAFAQSIPKPSLPEFTLKLIDHSYDVPERMATTIDPFTGKPYNFTMPGFHQENKTIEITIKNPSGATYYNFRWKGHSENEWSYEPFNPANPYTLEYSKFVPNNASTSTFLKDIPYNASTSTFTVFTLYFIKANAIPPGGEIDVQVQALYGNFDAVPSPSQPLHGGLYYDFNFKGKISDWSSTQTVTMPETSASTSPTPNPTPPSIPEFSSWTVPLLFAVMVVAAGLLVYHKKHKQKQLKHSIVIIKSFKQGQNKYTI
jgi:hypothetical protein